VQPDLGVAAGRLEARPFPDLSAASDGQGTQSP
jgi:hypothetical protein